MTPDEAKEKLALLRSALIRLSEHFDSLQIFGTVVEEEGTHAFNNGVGNWYARRGQVEEWLDQQEPLDRRDPDDPGISKPS